MAEKVAIWLPIRIQLLKYLDLDPIPTIQKKNLILPEYIDLDL